VPFRGAGWVYLGEQESQRGAAYDSRRMDTEGQTFLFRITTPGTYRLNFNKQDFVNNMNLNDTVEIIAVENQGGIQQSHTGSQSRVIAEPRWPPTRNDLSSIAQIFDNQPEVASTEQEIPVAASSPASTEEAALVARAQPADYLTEARSGFTAGKFPQTVSALDRFREDNPALTDEAWWLYGQSFESNSEVRDIKAAVDAYRHIVEDFPQSSYYDKARGRIAYLNRFFFNIR
jgi:hypothetical protein